MTFLLSSGVYSLVGMSYVYNVVQPLPLVSENSHHSKQKLCKKRLILSFPKSLGTSNLLLVFENLPISFKIYFMKKEQVEERYTHNCYAHKILRRLRKSS